MLLHFILQSINALSLEPVDITKCISLKILCQASSLIFVGLRFCDIFLLWETAFQSIVQLLLRLRINMPPNHKMLMQNFC